MNNKKNSSTALSGILWRFAERCGAQGVTFVVSLILARLLAPEIYGTVALITVFTGILQVFVDSGFGSALIQKKDADNLDFSTVFYFNITACSLLYLMMFLAAPYIALFYEDETLTPVIRAVSLVIVISGLKNVQQAYVFRNLLFKRFFFATLGGTIGAAVIGIAMAYQGYGVWALAVQMLFNAAADTMILWMTVRWRPGKSFSFERLKQLFSYGWKLLASGLLDTFYNDLRQLLIGKLYTPSDLAYYNQGGKIPGLFVNNVNTSIDSVLLPMMSEAQDECERVRNMTRWAIKTSTYIMAPLMMGLFVTAPVLVKLILTEKWLPCVPYLRIFCITYMFYPIHTANLNAIKAMGRSDYFLKLEIAKKIMGMFILLSTMWFGVIVMAYSLLLSSVLSQIINSWPNRKLLHYSYLEQMKDIMPGILLAVFMGGCISLIAWSGFPDVIIMALQVSCGAVIYIGTSMILKLDSFYYLLGVVKPYLTGKRLGKIFGREIM